MHVGQEPNKEHGSVNVPLHLSTTYAQKAPTEFFSEFEYARGGTPTRAAYEAAIAAVEYGKYAIAFASGCAAMTCVLHTLNPGDHVLICDDVYGGTNRYMRRFAQEKHNIEVEFTNMENPELVASKVKANTKLVWMETPTNPLLTINPVKRIIEAVRAKEQNGQKIVCLVDNTFATPYLQSPLQLGADISLNSVSKYIGGHSDIIGGTLSVVDKELHQKLFFASISFGGCPSTFDCWLAMRSLKTLESRMRLHCRYAYIVANFLEKHPLIEKVLYPGLESHKNFKNAKENMRGSGGMISFYLKGGRDEAKKFFQALKVITLAESLGGVESLIECPAMMTHASVPAEQRKELGITDNLIRLSVGIEDPEDLCEDLHNALVAMGN